jgi:nucleotide-binding universal stress UspA family protein
MKRIVCATRGGEGSRAAQMSAIQQARQTGAPLVFLYVTDPSSVGPVDVLLLPALRAELNWMGRTLLQVAKHRAESAGLLAHVEILEGQVREEIGRFLRESDAALLVLGAPRGNTANVFGDDAVEQFAHSIQTETGIAVQVVRPETHS